ncbi:CocE/NonD family hydrolase [Pseudoalteromonas luteoviolacea]|uniref:CocE/NonD family hydrolase n=1 Tax=Pseudoalteromonas luteoviolacea TaxID=43657 RepID=UPI001EEDF4BD|nr:CocE/NonD family hydrolase [Pseudoalteromonas luteoviolacea]MCF6440003.1 CocE/NonD family hydrolase [Pseudoalteromonas luteoviolacea]
MRALALFILFMGVQFSPLAAKDMLIPLRDNTQLAATLYLPEQKQNQFKKFPVIVQFTPYGRAEAKSRGEYFSQHGYIFVAVDSRGLGDSAGQFLPFIDEGKDGYDVIEYLAQYPLSNGKVGTLGGSYRGFAQWAIQKYRPPSLHSMVAIASVYPGYDFPIRNNIFSDYAISWLDFVLSKDESKRYGSGDGWSNAYLQQKNNGTAFKDLDKYNSHLSKVYQAWLARPNYDKYWQNMVPERSNYTEISTPILSITGHYDGDQRGTLKYYKNHLQWAKQQVFEQHYLIMGPWDHSGTRVPKRQVHQAQFKPQSMLDMPKVYLDWFNWTLKGRNKPMYLSLPVLQYIQSKGQWLGQHSLRSGSNLEHASLQSMLINQREHSVSPVPYSSYDYDPKKEITLPEAFDMTGSVDLPSEQSSYVAFETPALEQNKVLFGQFEAHIWLSMNVADTDVYLEAFEACPDSAMRLLSQAQRRIKYRDTLSSPVSTPINVPFSVKFDDFDWVAREINQGCKLRFLFRSSKWHQQKHFNSALPVAFHTMANAQEAEIRILHSDDYSSHIQIPWLDPNADVVKPLNLPLSQ